MARFPTLYPSKTKDDTDTKRSAPKSGNGMRTCDAFFDTRGKTEWTTRCQAEFAMPNSTTRASITDGLDIAGRFKWRNHSLSCLPDVPPADTIVPLDWACKNVALSREALGVISADCPADLGLDEYVRSTINLNRCIGLNATEPGWPVAEKELVSLSFFFFCWILPLSFMLYCFSWTLKTQGVIR